MYFQKNCVTHWSLIIYKSFAAIFFFSLSKYHRIRVNARKRTRSRVRVCILLANVGVWLFIFFFFVRFARRENDAIYRYRTACSTPSQTHGSLTIDNHGELYEIICGKWENVWKFLPRNVRVYVIQHLLGGRLIVDKSLRGLIETRRGNTISVPFRNGGCEIDLWPLVIHSFSPKR